MGVEVVVGLLGAVPFVSLLALWKRRRPTPPTAAGHIAVAWAASIAAMIAAAGAVGLEEPAFLALLLPVMIAGLVVGLTAKQRHLIVPSESDSDASR